MPPPVCVAAANAIAYSEPMGAARKILDEALALPAEERAALVDALTASLQPVDARLTDVGNDAHAALRYARAVAVLKADRAHEERIDQIIDARARAAGPGRSLRRRS